MLSHLEGQLLLSKGGTRGTKKEWSINLRVLPIVKKLILDQDFDQLLKEPSLVAAPQ
jgi:hypothetical protein